MYKAIKTQWKCILSNKKTPYHLRCLTLSQQTNIDGALPVVCRNSCWRDTQAVTERESAGSLAVFSGCVQRPPSTHAALPDGHSVRCRSDPCRDRRGRGYVARCRAPAVWPAGTSLCRSCRLRSVSASTSSRSHL